MDGVSRIHKGGNGRVSAPLTRTGRVVFCKMNPGL